MKFKDWKGKLGWKFTAKECEYEYWFCRHVAKWFDRKFYGKSSNRTIVNGNVVCPTLMNAKEAEEYLGVPYKILIKGLRLGIVKQYYKPGLTRNYYKKTELDKYRAYLLSRAVSKK